MPRRPPRGAFLLGRQSPSHTCVALTASRAHLQIHPGLADVVLLITVLVAFLETSSSTVRRLRPSLF
ncbi:MAG: hypothetical protein ACK46L_16160 [Synechococcaceae cyanobacterium]